LDHKGQRGVADPIGEAQRTEARETDHRLIDGLRANDREALATIYDTYSGIAYGMALHILGNSAEAEDAVQDAFLALWRQADRLDEDRGLRSYLLTIVHNKCVDRLRRRGRKPEAPLDLDAPIPSPATGPEDAVAAQAERESVRNALVGLPQEQRRTVEMAYFAGMTLNEVASRMQVPLGTVKSRLRLAMGHLRRSLAES
jgi:RNA polymerase sigma-70 factor (ECF subfamily)